MPNITVGEVKRHGAASSVVTTDTVVIIQGNSFKKATPAQTIAGAGVTSSVAELNVLDTSAGSPGTLATLTGVTSSTQKIAPRTYITHFALSAYSLAITDAGGSGSYGGIKLMDLPEGFIEIHSCSQVYTVLTADGTGVTATAVLDIGVGSAAIATPANGALAGTDDDIGDEIVVTLGTTTLPVTKVTVPATVFDGSATAKDIALNASGTAATVSANGTLAVTGWIQVVWSLLGDD